MHTDEAINAYITGQLLAGGTYHYDPRDRHGPALYAMALPLARMAGARNLAGLTATMVRMGPILTGTLAVFLFVALVADLSLPVAFLAALLWAVAPLPVYYSRYFIHETLFVAATLGLLSCGWRWLNTGSALAATMAGFWAALMIACKETAVLSFAAAAVAVGWWLFRRRARRGNVQPRLLSVSNGFEQSAARLRSEKIVVPRLLRWLGIGLGLLVAMALVVFFYSWGGRNWSGLADLIRSGPRFLARAGGEGHEKPWPYYLLLLAGGWSGWALLLLAAVGAFAALKDGASSVLSFWLVYGLAITAIYSVIPYKTPWLALNLFLPLAVLAAAGAVTLWGLAHELNQPPGTRPVLLAAAAGVLLLLGHDTWLRVFHEPADERNPYAYAHTGEDMSRLPERLAKIVGPHTTIAVVSADPWPLPWYLRKFPRVGYWQPGQNPARADLYLTSPEAASTLANRLVRWRWEYFGVRPGVLLILWTPPANH
jgi:uncharacterized protein (TIGR03663 family)